MRVLLVDDSSRVRATVAALLRREGFHVTTASACADARAAVEAARFEAAIIDIGLPDGSGTDLCRELREAGHEMSILLLTARSEIEDRVRGLDAGADDYMPKPFAGAELCARLRALGRRGPRWSESLRAFGAIRIDHDRREVTKDGALVALTPRELDVVTLLAWADGRVLSRDHILETVWGEASERTSASLEVHVTRIRRKLDEGVIRTVRELGYAWTPRRSS